MASPDVHVKTGNCSVCGKEFTKLSMVLNIRSREAGFIIRKKACGDCYNAHYSKGE